MRFLNLQYDSIIPDDIPNYTGNNNPAKRDCVRKKISDFVYSLGDNHPMKSIENRKKQSEMMKNNNPSKRNDVKQKNRILDKRR